MVFSRFCSLYSRNIESSHLHSCDNSVSISSILKPGTDVSFLSLKHSPSMVRTKRAAAMGSPCQHTLNILNKLERLPA